MTIHHIGAGPGASDPDLVWFSGGFPEVHRGQLHSADSLMEAGLYRGYVLGAFPQLITGEAGL